MSTRHQECSRRHFLAGLAALGGAAVLPAGVMRAQAPGAQGAASGARRLDVHAHFASPTWNKKNIDSKRAGYQQLMNWTPAKAIEEMDKAGVAVAMLSSTQPGVSWTDDFSDRADAIAIAREMNEYAAKLVADNKGRFGLFALLPLPDIDASLKEIAYAFDTLKADGVGLMTSYGNRYIGEAIFDPILQELNRRNAVLYSHPTEGPCCHNLGGQAPGTIEWYTDTSRAILSVLAEGPGQGPNRPPSAATKYPNINYIWSHGGGTLIAAAHRIIGPISADDLAKAPAPNSRLFHARRFYYDTALNTNPVVFPALAKLLGNTSHIVFGTDYPFGNQSGTVEALKGVGFSEQELKGIDRDNALAILPKFKA
jgi:predicted TIM-barrel fold metal-dependent hydrolase